ncbi:MAG: hypothetical protein HFE78_05905 [Clostridiales bacterium]|nr:hypothetical protein [Clostridiales bacterium]
MIKVVTNLIAESKWNLKCPYELKPTRIVVHNTANDASAQDEIAYMGRNNSTTSYHYAVDDVQAVQGLPLDRNGWHAGDGAFGKGNREGIGIEICYSKSGGKRFEAAQKNAAELCVLLLKEQGWGLDLGRITKHEDYAPKHCPHRTLDNYGWDYFLKLVQQKYEEMEEEPMTKEEKVAFEKLATKVDTLVKENTELKERLDKYDKMGVYENAAIKWAYNDGNLPSWARETVKKLTNKGYLYGNDKNSLELSYIMLRLLVILDRAGCFGE